MQLAREVFERCKVKRARQYGVSRESVFLRDRKTGDMRKSQRRSDNIIPDSARTARVVSFAHRFVWNLIPKFSARPKIDPTQTLELAQRRQIGAVGIEVPDDESRPKVMVIFTDDGLDDPVRAIGFPPAVVPLRSQYTL